MNTPDSIISPIFAGIYGIQVSDSLISLILFVLYAIFGPGALLFEIATLVRYYIMDIKENSKPDALIQWTTDPRVMKRGFGLATVITLAPVAYVLLTR